MSNNLHYSEVQRRALRKLAAASPAVDSNGRRIDGGNTVYEYDDEGNYLGSRSLCVRVA